MNGNGTTVQADQPPPMDPTPPTPAASPHAVVATANGAVDCTAVRQEANAHARRAKAATTTSPKVKASTLGGAIAVVFWTVATATFWKNTFSTETLAALIASTTTIAAAGLAYWQPDQLRSGG